MILFIFSIREKLIQVCLILMNLDTSNQLESLKPLSRPFQPGGSRWQDSSNRLSWDSHRNHGRGNWLLHKFEQLGVIDSIVVGRRFIWTLWLASNATVYKCGCDSILLNRWRKTSGIHCFRSYKWIIRNILNCINRRAFMIKDRATFRSLELPTVWADGITDAAAAWSEHFCDDDGIMAPREWGWTKFWLTLDSFWQVDCDTH